MINKAILVGRLGKDPESRTTQSGKEVCRFTMATDSGFGQQKKTDWHSIVCFDRQAEFVKNYLRKGNLVYVEGRISYNEYEKDGVKRYTTEIIASTVQSLGGKNESGAGSFNAADSYGSASPSYNAPSSRSGDAMGASSNVGMEADFSDLSGEEMPPF